VGLAHLGTDEGQVLRLRAADGHPTLATVVDLGTEPQAVLPQADGSVFVLTNRQLRKLSADGEISDLCGVDYAALYPQSLAVLPSGEYYVGMRHFVGRLTPRPTGGCTVEWFAPSDCRRFSGGADVCACAE
jgi:hypothetical protein